MAGCSLLCNTDFELPVLPVVGPCLKQNWGTSQYIDQTCVPCWKTTNDSPTYGFNIEIWKGNSGPGPHSGTQFVEINSDAIGKLYQDFIAIPGTTISISFWHAGRFGFPNTMKAYIADSILGTPLIILGPFTAIVNTWQQHTITYTFPPINTNYTIVFESLDGHDGGNFIDDVQVNLTPPSITASSLVVGSTILLQATTVPFASSYSWVGPNGYTSMLQNPTILGATGLMTGTYTVTVTDQYGCTNTSSTNVVIQDCILTISVLSNSPLCEGETLNLTTPSVTGATYSWTGPNGFTSTLQNPSISNVTIGMTGNYIVIVTIPQTGCTGTATTTVIINPTPLNTVLTSNSPLSVGDTILLMSTPAGVGETYSWIGPNGFTSTIQNPTIPSATLLNAGLYTLTITNNRGCTSVQSIEIFVINVPCWLITDCNPDGQSPFVTQTDLSTYEGQTVKTCIGDLLRTKTQPPAINSCFELTNCCDNTDIIIIKNPPGNSFDYIGWSITFPILFPGKCWTIRLITCPEPLSINYVNITWGVLNIDYILYNNDISSNSCTQCGIANDIPCAIPLTFYKLTDCCNDQNILIIGSTSTNFPYLGFTIQVPSIPQLGNKCWIVGIVPINTDTSLSTIIINPDVNIISSFAGCVECNANCYTEWPDGCYCVTITRATNCAGNVVWPGVITEVYTTCELCIQKCYILTDCTNPDNILHVSNDFSLSIGMVIKLTDCGDTCWIVSEALDCINSTCVKPIEFSYTTCIDCLPVVLPIPVEDLRSRRIKPGYYTLGCSPEYTERVNCTFAETVFDEMAKKRYGITVCCDNDLDEIDIKKQELDLRTICSDIIPMPLICKEPSEAVAVITIPPCTTWNVVCNSIGEITYTNCLGELMFLRTRPGSITICSMEPPILNVVDTAINTGIPCT